MKRTTAGPPLPEPGTAGSYAEHAPSAVLRPFVECFWSREPSTGRDADSPVTRRILPDGCIDIVIGVGESPDARAVGTMTRALVFSSTRATRFVGVRFRPGAAFSLGVPAAALTDLRVPLSDLWTDSAGLTDALSESSSSASAVSALERELVARLHSARAESPRFEVSAAVALISRAGGARSIASVASTLGVTRQHLARCFNEAVGVPPKMYARVVRVRRVIERARRDGREARINGRTPAVDWSALAHANGYFDQAHLVADFKSLVGVTPERWLEEQHAVV